jgi:hypothetical protein
MEILPQEEIIPLEYIKVEMVQRLDLMAVQVTVEPVVLLP